jgi:hypothetical protein
LTSERELTDAMLLQDKKSFSLHHLHVASLSRNLFFSLIARACLPHHNIMTEKRCKSFKQDGDSIVAPTRDCSILPIRTASSSRHFELCANEPNQKGAAG